MMKISKSKRQLAQLLIDAGVKEFPNGADWAAQGSTDLKASFYSGYKPNRGFGEDAFCGNYCGRCHDVQLPSLINNWHQTALSCDEFDQIVAEIVADAVRDADGWIEWNGGECPVEDNAVIDIRFRDGNEERGVDADWDWEHSGGGDIIAYRLHKQADPEFCESVMRSIPEPEAKPTIEQLAADYRNAKDYAERKQQEADDAKADVEAKLTELVAAGKVIGLVLSVAGVEPELGITVQVGDEVECVKPNVKPSKYNGMIGRLHTIDESDTSTPYLVDFGGYGTIWCHEVKFIRRP